MNSRRCRKQFVFYPDFSSDFMLVPHMSLNLTGEKYSMMHKDLKDLERSERFQKPRWPHSDGTIKDWILAPVFWRFWREFLNAAAKLSIFIRSITTKKEMTCLAKQISAVQEHSKTYFSVKGFVILFFDEVFILITERLAGKVSTFLSFW